jgi:hypothetical protein
MTRVLFAALFLTRALAELPAIWIEGEDFTDAKVSRHPWYHGESRSAPLSGKDFVSHYSDDAPGEVHYQVTVEKAGDYELWVRANPVQARLLRRIGAGEWREIDLTRQQTGTVNLAKDDKPDLRFIAWANAGPVKLSAGKKRVSFRFDSKLSHHGSLDCFVFAAPGFQPMDALKPDEIATRMAEVARANEGWVPCPVGRDGFSNSPLDLRFLNEKFAGENGGIVRRGDAFAHRDTGEPLRFWGVNGPPHELKGGDLARCARMLASRGVNLVRIHGAVFDEKTGALDPAKVRQVREIVAAMKKEGIYSLLSVYFPLWMKPTAGTGWREGYDGSKHPFALLYFEPEFQQLHRSWLTALLDDGLAGDPAVMGVEIINEDSFFFWTFAEENIPAPQLRKLEARFARWAAARHGSVEKALAVWKLPHARDGDGRLGLRPLYQMFTERTPRDQDSAAFLMETQRGFYQETATWLRDDLGFRGLITASNWTTANNDIFGPLEKYSYSVGDFIDRHGYFGCSHQGDQAAWSIRDGHSYRDRSALKFQAEAAGKPADFSHPAVDPTYNGMPSMISETTWTRPNRHRGEAPLFYAAYGALQGSDAIVHFALDSADWAVKPGFFMQPWTLMSPTQIGQFPAAALIFRQGLIAPGAELANFTLTLADATALKGSPLAPAANLDELRKADTPAAGATTATSRKLDPLIHFAGKTALHIGAERTGGEVADLTRHVDRQARRVTSTTGEVRLDYGKGLLTLRAPAAQGAIGDLAAAGTIDLPDLSLSSPLDVASMVLVSLDGQPIQTSRRMLLQVMSEEKATGFATEPGSKGRRKILNIGTDPWLMRRLSGQVRLKRPDAATLKATPLDLNGAPLAAAGTAVELKLLPEAAYYLISSER